MSAQSTPFQLDTALTDYLLCLEALVFLYLISQVSAGSPRLRLMSALLFGTLAVASLLGGVSHTFFTDHETPAYQWLWLATMLTIGAIGWSAWNLGAAMLDERWRSLSATLSSLVLGSYAIVVTFISQRYLIAIGHYLIGVVFLLSVLASIWRRTRQPGSGQTLVGVLLSVVAPLPHLLHYSPLPQQLSPNATYHLIQAFALLLIFAGLKTMLAERELHTEGRENQRAQ